MYGNQFDRSRVDTFMAEKQRYSRSVQLQREALQGRETGRTEKPAPSPRRRFHLMPTLRLSLPRVW